MCRRQVFPKTEHSDHNLSLNLLKLKAKPCKKKKKEKTKNKKQNLSAHATDLV